MDRPEKGATPEAPVTAQPPLQVPPAGLVPIAKLIVLAVSEVWMLLLALPAATLSAVLTSAPLSGLEGEGAWARLGGGGAPGVMLKAAEVAAVYEGVLEAVSV